jgi:hypothetical protein
VAEGARLESVFTRKGNVGSNPTLSATNFTRGCVLFVLLPYCQCGNFGQSHRFLIRNYVAVLHGGTDIGMTHQFLLNGQFGADCVEPGTIAVSKCVNPEASKSLRGRLRSGKLSRPTGTT